MSNDTVLCSGIAILIHCTTYTVLHTLYYIHCTTCAAVSLWNSGTSDRQTRQKRQQGRERREREKEGEERREREKEGQEREEMEEEQEREKREEMEEEQEIEEGRERQEREEGQDIKEGQEVSKGVGNKRVANKSVWVYHRRGTSRYTSPPDPASPFVASQDSRGSIGRETALTPCCTHTMLYSHPAVLTPCCTHTMLYSHHAVLTPSRHSISMRMI
jgi:hypothetical protein